MAAADQDAVADGPTASSPAAVLAEDRSHITAAEVQASAMSSDQDAVDTPVQHTETEAFCGRWSCGTSCARRLQTAAVLLLNWPASLLAGLATMGLLLYLGGWFRIFICVYVGWIVFVDDQPHKGDRAWPALKRFTAPMYAWLRDFFPVELVKTTELDPSRRYVFGYHPHGILSVGAFINFASDATGFTSLFPGVDLRLLTLAGNMLVPFHREWAMAHGAAVASRQCCLYNLRKGRSVLLVLGGAQESLDAQEGTINLTLLKRKGFVRIALSTGASLVPCLSFGENDVLTQWGEAGSSLRAWQEFAKAWMGFAPPCPKGRGIWNLDGMDVAVVPHRRRIVTVVGRPLHVEAPNSTPTEEQVTALHTAYVEELARLFHEYGPKYAPGVELNFVA